jgi:hypothetical protein
MEVDNWKSTLPQAHSMYQKAKPDILPKSYARHSTKKIFFVVVEKQAVIIYCSATGWPDEVVIKFPKMLPNPFFVKINA